MIQKKIEDASETGVRATLADPHPRGQDEVRLQVERLMQNRNRIANRKF
jgi:hypothetical protein